MAQSFNDIHKGNIMALDPNEKKLVEKLVEALSLLEAGEQDIRTISETKNIDKDFFIKAGQMFEDTEACDVCRHAFHSWRNVLDDETILSFIDDWIKWKKQNPPLNPKARIVKMRKTM